MDCTLKSFSYRQDGKEYLVHPSLQERAREIDGNGDGFLDDPEIVDHFRRQNGFEDREKFPLKDDSLLQVLHPQLRQELPSIAEGYHSYEDVDRELTDLANHRPDLAEKVSLGKTWEDRDIWALRISSNVSSPATSKKPGVVLTGAHHADEWLSMEAPLALAHDLVENYDQDRDIKSKVDNAEIWIVPLVNPDGYEFSRSGFLNWRKNRQPVGEDALGNPSGAIGTDINRNYFDDRPEHAYLYRPEGDTPQITRDDHGQVSDDPYAHVYRGGHGASEREVQAMLGLELGRGNIRGVLDHHGYGNMFLYPGALNTDPVPKEAGYLKLGNRINQAVRPFDTSYQIKKSAQLYLSSGVSHDILDANGITACILEIGADKRPPADTIQPVLAQTCAADKAFIGAIIAGL